MQCTYELAELEEIDMENLDQGFFASGLDSFDMGVIQNRRPGWTSGGLERSPKVDHNEEIREDFTRVFPVVLFLEIQCTFFWWNLGDVLRFGLDFGHN